MSLTNFLQQIRILFTSNDERHHVPRIPATYSLEPSEEVWLPNFSSNCRYAEVCEDLLSFKGAAATKEERVRLSKISVWKEAIAKVVGYLS